MANNQKTPPICPICGQETFICLDEWGKTMMHIHCGNCGINVGGSPSKKTEEEFLAFAKTIKERHYSPEYRIINEEKVEIKNNISKYYFDYSVNCIEVRK